MSEIGIVQPGRPSRRRSVVAFLLGLLGIAILCLLGTWQVERLHWKEGLIRQIDARIHAAPVSVDAITDRVRQTGDVDYVPVQATGRFLNADERFFLSTWGGQSGWNLYVPMDLGDGRFVFVNRGFVPYDMRDPALRREGLIEGRTPVTGLARNVAAEKPSWMVPSNDLARNQFFWKNIPEMAKGSAIPAGATILPFVIDAGEGRAPGGWPVGGQTVIDIPNNHLQYAFTWYGLAAVLAVMMGSQVLRLRRAGGQG